MDIILFVLRTIFLVLIYVFIFILLIYLIRDLHKTQRLAETPSAGAGTGVKLSKTRGAGGDRSTGLLKLEYAPGEYGMDGAEYALSSELRLGRGADNEVILPDPYASNYHARLYLQDGQYWLEDLDSKNGTLLNGKHLAGRAVLVDGDQIQIGNIIFRFVRWGYEVEPDFRVRSGAQKE